MLLAALLLIVGTPTAGAQKRVALVVGNSAYQHTAPLANPKNDATDLSATLKKRGFEVIEGLDLDKAAFDRKLRDFAAVLQGAETGLFFFAGHGLQVGGQNYLVPVDAQLTTAAALDFETVSVNVVQRVMEHQSNTNLLFLDACRDNPLARNLARAMGTRSAEIGLGFAPIVSGVGTLISFSTQPGSVALDGTGRNSPFAGALIKQLSTSNEDLSGILISVRNDVMMVTQRKQVPWEHSALTGRFYFSTAPHAAAELREPKSSPPDRAKFYRLLMDKVLSQKHGKQFDPLERTNQYREKDAPKALAVCINWEVSTAEKPAFFSWGYATRHDPSQSKTQKEIDTAAIGRCKSGARFECECIIVDRNDKDALTLPPDWVKQGK